MIRIYKFPIDIAAFGTAAGDVFEIAAATNTIIKLLHVEWGQIDSEVWELIGWKWSRRVTTGSGGTTVNANSTDPGAGADDATVEVANTTDASGTETELARGSWNSLNQIIYQATPEEVDYLVGGGDVGVFNITDTPVINFDIQGYGVFQLEG